MKELIYKTGLEIREEIMTSSPLRNPEETAKQLEQKLSDFADKIKDYYENKAKDAIRVMNKSRDYHDEKTVFCREHNMRLDEIKHIEIETALRKIKHETSNLYGFGYIG